MRKNPTKPKARLIGINDELLNRKEACEFLKIKPRTLDGWRAQRALPFIARGRWVRFRRSDLEAFVNTYRNVNTCRKGGAK